MIKIDTNFLREAKKQFAKEYGSQVKDLGYHLTHEITKVGDSLGILALVCNNEDNNFPPEVMQQIDDLIPSNYSYKGQDVPVKVEYRGPAIAQSKGD